MRARDQYLEFLEEWLSPLGEITSRAMFGGHCLYCDGVMTEWGAAAVEVERRARAKRKSVGENTPRGRHIRG